MSEYLADKLAEIVDGYSGINIGIAPTAGFFDIVLLHDQDELNEVEHYPWYDSSCAYDGTYLGRMNLNEAALDIIKDFVAMPIGEERVAYLKSVVSL